MYRKIQDNKLWLSEKFTKGQAWVDLLILANHKPQMFFKRGIQVEVKRGQVGWSEKALAIRWQWSRSKIRTFLKMLETEHQIRHQKDKVTTIITIVNFEIYNEKDIKKDIKRTSKRHQKDTNKNVKKEKNENKEEEKEEEKEKIKPLLLDKDFSDILQNKEKLKDLAVKIKWDIPGVTYAVERIQAYCQNKQEWKYRSIPAVINNWDLKDQYKEKIAKNPMQQLDIPIV